MTISLNFLGMVLAGDYILSIEFNIYQKGIADAFLIAEDWINKEKVALILGDNIYHGHGFSTILENVVNNNTGATVFGYTVKDPRK